ncbi:MAG: alpha/beta hydrolase-fold protein [Bacilli bacterium]
MAHIEINFISEVLLRAVDVMLVLPSKTTMEGMMDKGKSIKTYYQDQSKKKFPLLILLHGMANNYKTWANYARVELFAEEHNIAIAMISGENKFYLNNKSDRFWDFIEYELKDYLYGVFPISSKREDNFIAGLSMGGFGALYHAVSNPKAYAAVGSFSGAIHLDGFKEMGFEPEFIPIKDQILKNKKDLPKFYVACGEDDFLIDVNKDFMKFLDENKVDNYHETIPHYTHEWRFWDMELEKFLNWIPRSDDFKEVKLRKV